MHFSIPDTIEHKDKNGTNYLAYNIHVNGSFHSAVRYSDLFHFNDQLRKVFGARVQAKFPPRKLLSLTAVQVDERREQLERYLQTICQDPDVSCSTLFTKFLLNCQKDSNKADEEVELEIYLMNGQKISLNVMSTDSSDSVLEAAMSNINLPEEMVYYFGLFLIQREESGDTTIVRKLQEFEVPYLALSTVKGTCRIAIRKSFWDRKIEESIIENRIGMNLLFVQAVSDVERGWVVGPKDAYSKLRSLKEKHAKKEYLKLAKMLKYYGYIQFKPCVTDYPDENTRVIVSIGDRELNFRLQTPDSKIQEGSFKVTRMRCWRITSAQNSTEDGKTVENMELAFEYLLTKDKLQWITISSDQAILMSLCLQSIVDEIISIKQHKPIRRPKDRSKQRTSGDENHHNIRRTNSISSTASGEGDDETSQLTGPSPPSSSPSASPSTKPGMRKQLPGKSKGGFMQIRTGQAPTSNATTTNEVFEGIGDDDL